MMSEPSWILIAICAFIVIGVFIIIKSFAMPKSFFMNQEQKEELRKKLPPDKITPTA